MSTEPPQKPEKASINLVTVVSMTLFGVVAAFVLLLAVLWLAPDLLLDDNSDYTRPYANQSISAEFKISDGNMYDALPGIVRPPEEDMILEAFQLAWDDDGFRVPRRATSAYPIAAFGDSFTEGFNVPQPWPDVLDGLLDVPVRNYGYRGYGPVEVARGVEEFGITEPRQWIIYAYFSGNDLGDAVRTLQMDDSILGRLKRLFSQQDVPEDIEPIVNDHYDFPMPVIIGGNYYELAFLHYYLYWNRAPDEGFESSRNFQSFLDSLDNIQQEVPAETCLALVFIPTKEQLYYPYIHPSSRQWLRGISGRMALDDDNYLYLLEDPIDLDAEDAFITSLDDQREAVANALAIRPEWHLIDLYPGFQDVVADGELLYYPFDTHWNQAGHSLAAEIIAEFLQNQPNCATSPD